MNVSYIEDDAAEIRMTFAELGGSLRTWWEDAEYEAWRAVTYGDGEPTELCFE